MVDVRLECVLKEMRHQIETVRDAQTKQIDAGRAWANFFARKHAYGNCVADQTQRYDEDRKIKVDPSGFYDKVAWFILGNA